MPEPRGKFEAFDEEGRRYTVYMYQEEPRGNATGGSVPRKGRDELRLADGETVNRHGPKLYSVASTGVRLTSTDRNAP